MYSTYLNLSCKKKILSENNGISVIKPLFE